MSEAGASQDPKGASPSDCGGRRRERSIALASSGGRE